MSQIFIPNSIEETCRLLTVPGRTLCAGATNLYVDRYLGKCLDLDIISLHKLNDLKYISHEADGWHIGSLCTFDMLENELADQGLLNALAVASSLVGGPQVRNRGTIGGNIVSASPSADSVPVLMSLDARVVLKSLNSGKNISDGIYTRKQDFRDNASDGIHDGKQDFRDNASDGIHDGKLDSRDNASDGIHAENHDFKERQVPIRDFMTGVKKTAIRPDELLTEIIIPDRQGKAVFRKVGKRNALAIALCNLCVYMKTAQVSGNMIQGNETPAVIIEEISIAIGSCAPTCVRASNTEQALLGRKRPDSEEEWAEIKVLIKETLSHDISPIDDVRTTASYRRKVAANLVYKLVRELW